MASFPQINRDRMPFPAEAIPDKILLLGASAHFLHLVDMAKALAVVVACCFAG